MKRMNFLKSKLHEAVLEQDLAKVKELIAAGEDINIIVTRNKNTLLHYAPTLEIAEELLANGANVNARNASNETPLYSAIHEGKDMSIIKAFLLAGADVKIRTTAYQNTLLHFATNKEVAKELLLYGADMNAMNVYEETPLHYAVSRRNFGVVTTLLSAGADVNKKNTHGNTPLHFAAEYGQELVIVQELLRYGAHVNETNVNGYTPLHLVSENSKELLLVRKLLNFDSRVNETIGEDNATLNALMQRYYYYSERRIEVIKELLEYDADINIEAYPPHPDIGRTPIAIALHYSEEAARVMVKMIVLKNYDQDYKKFLNIDGRKHNSRYYDLILFSDDCAREIARMKKHLLCFNYSINDLIIKKMLRPVFQGDKFLTQISIEYPIYQDIILPLLKLCLERGDLFDKFRKLQVCSVQDISIEQRQYVFLNPDCMYQIAEFLSNEDLCNFLYAMRSCNRMS